MDDVMGGSHWMSSAPSTGVAPSAGVLAGPLPVLDGGVPRGALAGALDAAVRAPSLYNSQPWHFRIGADRVEVRLDPSRMLPAADPGGRAARIACGAALYNLRLAMAVELGHESEVRLLPDRADDLLVAQVRVGRARPATPRERAQYCAIPRWRGNRHPFQDEEPVADAQHLALARAAAAQDCWLQVLTGTSPARRVAALIDEAGRVLDRDPAYRREAGPGTAGAVRAIDAVRASDVVQASDVRTRDTETVPSLGILGGADDTPPVHVSIGQALQSVLLTATEGGLAVSLFSQPFEVPDARTRLRELAGRLGTPYLVLRVGYPTRPSASTPRLPVAAVSDVLPDDRSRAVDGILAGMGELS
ncbi:MAG: nitroreductase family protein [Actinocatenispora sp.]